MRKTSFRAVVLSAALAATPPALAADDNVAPVKLDPEKRGGVEPRRDPAGCL